MSERLMNGLVTSKRELEAGVADATNELAQAEEHCRKLENLIAVGKATLHAAAQAMPQSSSSARETTPARISPAPSQNGQNVAAFEKRVATEA
jgi:uncharacterized protein YaaN involved in tellurite resistance